jgi:16S rRNA (adenine1518-N6/adenine1519-N6)-dimethyltransferase
VARPTLGQHFLADARAVARIVAALDLRPGEPVLEIGPGRGALTGALVREAGRVVAVELDARLARDLARRFGDRIALVEGDILRVDLDALPALAGAAAGARLVVAGNLPYAISKPITQKLIRERALVDRAVLMFQREVADRLTAAPGGRDYGPLGILAAQAFEIRRLFDLPPAAFRPAPRVVSTVTLWRPRPAGHLDARGEARLRHCLAACFARRRRTVRNNLRTALGNDERVAAALDAAGIDGELRAEQLPPEAFLRLAMSWSEAS